MRTAVVTGAGGSLGRAIAQRLAADGCALALTDLPGDALDETAALVRSHGAQVIAAPLDLTDDAELDTFFTRVADELAPVTTLVNNAAIYPTVAFLEMPVEKYDEVHRVNQRGYWRCAQLAGRQMLDPAVADEQRTMVNIASITMHGGWADLAAYVATKGAATSLTRALARELGPQGIRVNAVSPGAFPTAAEEIYDDPEAYSRQVIERQSLKRRGTPAELAAVVSFLTGPDSAFVTGQTIEVNGGWVMT
ncbi:SDR family oxidoreductase [Nakamurella sp. YIM 132087]|uniref:SDR family oxidoreductase n=1 Tax=Nakamurella alba TaxID=2665158 RepID=A0A7K1FJD8_9ACTN|nr:SDR family oxidoreductase [Nakamurella alba]MTD13373.1 SDR family oxidoreductase [Nakamurella alba]